MSGAVGAVDRLAIPPVPDHDFKTPGAADLRGPAGGLHLTVLRQVLPEGGVHVSRDRGLQYRAVQDVPDAVEELRVHDRHEDFPSGLVARHHAVALAQELFAPPLVASHVEDLGIAPPPRPVVDLADVPVDPLPLLVRQFPVVERERMPANVEHLRPHPDALAQVQEHGQHGEIQAPVGTCLHASLVDVRVAHPVGQHVLQLRHVLLLGEVAEAQGVVGRHLAGQAYGIVD